MSVVGAIRKMLSAGLSIEQALIAAEAFEQEQAECAPTRTAKQDRNARYYAKKASEKRLKASYSDVSDGIKTAEPASREEYNTTRAPAVIPVGLPNGNPPINSPLPSEGPPKAKSAREPTPAEILSEVVSPKTAADVVAHRKALRKPLTPRAAELLARSLAASGDAERAAATMIERGWQGYRADWDGATPNARAGPQSRKSEWTELYERLCEETSDHGNGSENNVFDGNVLGLPRVQNERRHLQDDAGELFGGDPAFSIGNR
jgi:hypothetical protein